MDLMNESGFEVAWRPAKIRPPAWSATFVVKGTFDLATGAPAEKAMPLMGEAENLPDDFAPFKPKTDLLLVGTCRPPSPVGAYAASFAVGVWSKRIAVLGPRSSSREEPAPFASLPLAGFGPLPVTSPQRSSKSGTYDRKWQKSRWPFFPEDFDATFWNAAPEDQQVPAFLVGNEEVRVDAGLPIATRLPGLRVRCFLTELVRTRSVVHEIPMMLDTLWIDVDAGLFTLVWRGNRDARDEKLYGFVQLHVVREKLEDPRTLEYYRKRLEVPPEPVEPAAIDEPAPAVESPSASMPELPDFDFAPLEAELEKARADVPRDFPSKAPAEPADFVADLREALDRASAILKEKGRPVPDEIARYVDAPLEIPPAGGEPPPPSTSETVPDEPRVEDLSGANLAGADLSNRDLRGRILTGADLSGANLACANLSGALLEGANLTGVQAQKALCVGTDFANARMSGADFREADLSTADLENADLTGARLASALAIEARFEGAVLRRADLTEAKLDRASFETCVLHDADFSRASLVRASLIRTWGRRVKLTGADASELRASGARLPELVAHELRGAGSIWDKAHLFAADFSRARLAGAEFASAVLARAKFRQADLREASLVEASLTGAEMARCNLFRATLRAADLAGADLTQANLYESNVRDARVEKTRLEQANLRRTLLEAT